MPQDEFIDDIPFPETQNYVKRILGHGRGLPLSLRRRAARPEPARVGQRRTGRQRRGEETGGDREEAGDHEEDTAAKKPATPASRTRR